jgi:chromosome segregation ATPase
MEKPAAPQQRPQKPGFDLPELLKQVQGQFDDLREELQNTRNQLRQIHQPAKQGEVRAAGPGKEYGELREENARLAETVAALRQTLSDLASENFDQAVSQRADSGEPVTDPVEQYKSLLTLRVREQIVNFQTLNRDNNVDALPLLLDNVLQTLQENGIDLENIETPPPQARRKY